VFPEKKCKTEFSQECIVESEKKCKTDLIPDCTTVLEPKCTVVPVSCPQDCGSGSDPDSMTL
jgi:hypothetical protein